MIRQLHTTLRTRLTLLYVFLLCIVLLLYVAWTSVFLWRTLLGELDLSLDRDIETVDSDKGIPLEHRKRVFERFYRIDKSRTRAEGGAGLGLSIAEWGVRAHGGRIELDCDPGPGCTFRIRLLMHPS